MKIRSVGPDLDQPAQPEKRGQVGHARGLLHVVGHDDDRVVGLELIDQLLDALRRDRIERRRRLVHQQDVGLDGQRARDAQPLLLAAGERERRLVQPILDLVPDRRCLEALLDARRAARRGSRPCR